MCLAQGQNVVTQVIAVANSLDPDQARQKVFPLILMLSMSSRSNDGKMVFFQKCPYIIRKTWLHPMDICAKIFQIDP